MQFLCVAHNRERREQGPFVMQNDVLLEHDFIKQNREKVLK